MQQSKEEQTKKQRDADKEEGKKSKHNERGQENFIVGEVSSSVESQKKSENEQKKDRNKPRPTQLQQAGTRGHKRSQEDTLVHLRFFVFFCVLLFL
ncbi:MAG: hypothetical protein IPK10_01515 [Bacteroidetes bacterium]|nr:hypothetical protein [Bacteroidota bacterium]